MGASVWLISEDAGGRTVAQILSNQHGAFFTDHLKPGNYAVRVSVAGFLPAMERHVAVMSNLTTLLRVQVETLFSSLDTLAPEIRCPCRTGRLEVGAAFLDGDSHDPAVGRHRQPNRFQYAGRGPAQRAASSRPGPGNQWRLAAWIRLESSERSRDRCFLRPTAWQPGTPAGCRPDESTTEERRAHLPAFGSLPAVRETALKPFLSGANPNLAPRAWNFRACGSITRSNSRLGDRFLLRAGAEYLRAGIISSVSSLRPHAQLSASLAPGLMASLIVAANPPSEQWGRTGALESAIDELDSLPPVLFHNGSPVLEGGWHQELSVKRKMGSQSTFEVAAFHDSDREIRPFSGPALRQALNSFKTLFPPRSFMTAAIPVPGALERRTARSSRMIWRWPRSMPGRELFHPEAS